MIIKRTIQSLVALLTIFLFVLLFFIFTTPGLKLAFHLASFFIPGKLSIEKMDGQLINHVTFENIRYTDKTSDTKIQSLKLNWAPIYLLAGRVNVKDLSIVTSQVETKIKGSFSFIGHYQTHLSGEATYSVANYDLIHLTMNVDGNTKDQLVFDVSTTAPFKFNLHGTLNQLTHHGNIQVVGRWKDSIIPFSLENSLSSPSGEINISGPLDRYTINSKMTLSSPQIPEGQWQISGTGSTHSINLERVNAAILGGNINGMATMTWQPTISWNATINGNNINPGIQWQDGDGSLRFILKSTGLIGSGQKKMTVAIPSITGKLHRSPIQGYFKGSIDLNQLTIDNSYLTVGKNSFRLSAQFDKNWDVHWDINAPNLTQVFPSSTGSLISQGQFSGANDQPQLQATATVKQFIFDAFDIEQLNANANIHLTPNGKTDLRITGKNIHWNKYYFKNADILGGGTVFHHTITAKMTAKNSNIYLALAGNFSKNGWNSTINRFDLSSRFYNDWHLKNPFNLSIGSGHIVATPFDWQSNSTDKVAGQFDLGTNRWNITLNSQRLPYEILAGLFPSRLKIDTLLNADIALSQNENDAIRGHFHLNTSDGKILYFDPDVEIPEPLYFDRLSFIADFDKNMQSRLTLTANGKTPISAQLNLPNYEKYFADFGHQKIDGFIKISLDSFSKLPGLFSSFKKFDGILQGDIKLSGTLKDPIFKGNTSLTNVNALINPYNTALQDFSIHLDFNHQDVNISGKGRMGDGTLTIKGKSSVFDPYNLSLLIDGNQLDIANTDEYQITASPSIKITFKKPTLFINGSIDIPKATISPQKFDTVTTLPATVIVTRGNARIIPTKSWLELWMKLKLSLGDAINLDVKGLTGNVTGNISIIGKPNLPVTATGELTIVNGKYAAYGEKLNIDKGRLIFSNGPLFNPGLDIQASKTIQQMSLSPTTTPQTNSPFPDMTAMIGMPSLPEISTTGTQKITVGIKVLGTQDDPVVSLFSTPGGLSDTDILSYLLLGVRGSQASQAQGQLLLIAANALGFSGSNLTDGIQHSLGFSEFGLESSTVIDTSQQQPTPQQNTSFAVGKFITPRVYVHYSMGILIPINILNIRYLLTKRISIQSETSTLGNGVDVFYTLER